MSKVILSSSKKWAEPKNIGIIVVAFDNQEHLKKLLKTIALQKQKNDFLIVIDNHPEYRSAILADKYDTVDKVIRSPKNYGFAKGCNVAVKRLPSNIDTILMLNPDTILEKNTLNFLRKELPAEWAGGMPLLTMANQKVNSAGNVLHISGLSWCQGFGKNVKEYNVHKEVVIISGACFLIRRNVWEEFGGFEENYFMYYEDTDLSLRIRLKGYKIGLIPNAHVKHDYDFQKSHLKWFYIERNRYLIIFELFPLPVIILLFPLLFMVELGLWGLAIIDGRFLNKLKASFSVIKVIPLIFRKRHLNKKNLRLSPLEFFNLLNGSIDTPILSRIQILNPLFNFYYEIVVILLRLFYPTK